MFFHTQDNFDLWLNGRYVEQMRQRHGDEEARKLLSQEEEDAYVFEAVAEIADIAMRRDPPPEPDPDDDFEDEEDDPDEFHLSDDGIGGEG